MDRQLELIAQRGPPQRTTHARRVLVTEDNPDAAKSLREALELGNHEAAVASSGPEGIEAARRHKSEVVLCDLGLPEIDGYGVARALRGAADPAVRTALLVALSGYALQEDIESSKAAGFDFHSISRSPRTSTRSRRCCTRRGPEPG